MRAARRGLARGALALAALAGGSAARAGELQLAEVLRLALSQNADMRVQAVQVEAAQAQQEQAAGQFDWLLAAGADYQKSVQALPPSAAREQTRSLSTGLSAGVSKQLRNGLFFSSNVDAGAQSSDVPPLAPQQNLTRLKVALTVPLLQGRGSAAVTAAEQAAEAGVLGSRYALRDRAARTVHAALQAYWQYRARVALYAVARDSAQRSGAMLESMGKLVAADQKPRADLVLLRADLADKEAAREAAALALAEARRVLGRLLGLRAQQIEALPEPAADFPAVSALEAALSERAAALQQLALAQRPDVRVLEQQQQALQYLLVAARNGEQPRLDLKLGLGYGRASEGGSLYGFINQPGRTQNQPSVFVSLKYELPLGNHAARGLSRGYAAQASELEVQQRDLADGIASGVDSALQALASSTSQLAVAEQGMGLYEQAVQQELVKQRNGIATLIDVINVEARFVNARSSLLQLQLAHALALARLRFETGSLLPSQPLGSAGAEQIELAPGELAGLGPLAQMAATTR